MTTDATLNVRSLWDAATQRSGGETRLGDVLSVMSGPTSVVKIQTLARALFDSSITEETRPVLLPVVQKIREWKHFESLDWRTRSSTKIALARLNGNPTWLITALECCKSFFRAISFSRLSRRPIDPMLDKEIEKASRRQAARNQSDIYPTAQVDNDDDDLPPIDEAVLHDEDPQHIEMRQGSLPAAQERDPTIERLCAQELSERREASLQIVPWVPSAYLNQPGSFADVIRLTSVNDLKQFHDNLFASIRQAKSFFKSPSYSLAQKARLMGHAIARGRASMRDVQTTVGAYEIRLAKAFLKYVNGALSLSVDDYLSGVLGKSRRVWARVIREDLGLTGRVGA